MDPIHHVVHSYHRLSTFFHSYVLESAVVRYAVSFLTFLYTLVIVRPAALFYFRTWWGGRDVYDMCAEMSSVPSSHWMKNEEDCLLQLEKKFDAFLVCITILLGLATTYKIFNHLCYRWFTLPIETERDIRLMRARANIVYDYLDRIQTTRSRELQRNREIDDIELLSRTLPPCIELDTLSK